MNVLPSIVDAVGGKIPGLIIAVFDAATTW
jgi:hypothetical protein